MIHDGTHEIHITSQVLQRWSEIGHASYRMDREKGGPFDLF
jgi:hypothetical protein